ncbi:CBS domain-containing protein [Deltaproteobacteria bacterium TL4]
MKLPQVEVHSYGCIHIVEGEKLVGIFTEGDVLHKVVDKVKTAENLPISQFMTSNSVTLDLEDSIALAFHQMSVSGLHHLPVLKRGKPLGFVSSRRLLAYFGGPLDLST